MLLQPHYTLPACRASVTTKMHTDTNTWKKDNIRDHPGTYSGGETAIIARVVPAAVVAMEGELRAERVGPQHYFNVRCFTH